MQQEETRHTAAVYGGDKRGGESIGTKDIGRYRQDQGAVKEHDIRKGWAGRSAECHDPVRRELRVAAGVQLGEG